jgi:vacuolar protein sorting-associated protein 13A/C
VPFAYFLLGFLTSLFCLSFFRFVCLQLRMEGYKWSTPFSIHANGVMCVLMNSDTGNDQAFVRVNVRSGTKSSRYEVVFQLACWSSPYR